MTRLWLDEIWLVDEEERATLGEETTLGSILDELPYVMQTLRALKGMDPDAYQFFAKTGAPIAGDASLFSLNKVHPTFLQHMPAYTGFFWRKAETVECGMVCAYMKKLIRPVNVQPSNHDIYEVSGSFKWRARFFPYRFFCAITHQGEVYPLKQLLPKYRAEIKVTRMEWGFGELADLAADKGMTPEEKAREIVCVTTSAMPEPRSFLVRATKGKGMVTFRIHPRASAKFFRDRDVYDKRNNKIFHYRRGHYRANGRFVRPCYPGAQRFMWNGYSVRVYVPKTETYQFGLAAYDYRDSALEGVKTIDSAGVADKLAQVMEASK